MIAYLMKYNDNDVKYQVGRTYVLKGDPKQLHKVGFIAYWNVADINRDYPFDYGYASEHCDIFVMEVEIPDDATTIADDNASSRFVTNKLKVLRILSEEDIEQVSNSDVKFDNNGNISYIRYSDGSWMKRKFDEEGREIYYERSDGYWERREFNERGEQVYYEDSTGYWERREFDENGNAIYYENSEGYWVKREFDENSNEVYYESSDGYWERKKVDKDGNEIYYENSNGIRREIEIV